MEMRTNDSEHFKQGGQSDFEEIKEFVYSTKQGIALVDEEGNEEIYVKEHVSDLFCLIGQDNINHVEYIQNDFMVIETANDSIKGFNITLKNNKKYTIEVL